MRHFAEAQALAPVLQKMCNGVDDRIVIEVVRKKGSWGWRMNDPWGGSWWTDRFREVKDYIQTGC